MVDASSPTAPKCSPTETAPSTWPLVDGIPPSDLNQLAGLPANEAQAWAHSRIDEYRQLVDILITFHNAMALIHRTLPTELLAEIFIQRVLADHPNALVVAHVCRKWRAVALDTPCLWAA
ncbi:uncharacterized protein BXZ73DRAFT_49636, partial [Epithele typhae]|uniref:uncharacterized protein n=1 Tax=Epithele typhae TaxID=378194 RepID=UPI002008894E